MCALVDLPVYVREEVKIWVATGYDKAIPLYWWKSGYCCFCQIQVQGVSKYMQPINMIMIYYWDKRNGGHLEHAW